MVNKLTHTETTKQGAGSRHLDSQGRQGLFNHDFGGFESRIRVECAAMVEPAQNLTTKDLLARIVRLEDYVRKNLTTISQLFDRIEALERHNVAEHYNRQIDQKLDEYEKKNPRPDSNGTSS